MPQYCDPASLQHDKYLIYVISRPRNEFYPFSADREICAFNRHFQQVKLGSVGGITPGRWP